MGPTPLLLLLTWSSVGSRLTRKSIRALEMGSRCPWLRVALLGSSLDGHQQPLDTLPRVFASLDSTKFSKISTPKLLEKRTPTSTELLFILHLLQVLSSLLTLLFLQWRLARLESRPHLLELSQQP